MTKAAERINVSFKRNTKTIRLDLFLIQCPSSIRPTHPPSDEPTSSSQADIVAKELTKNLRVSCRILRCLTPT